MNMSADAAERLRKNLPAIRNVVGWSGEHLAELLGVSRFTIINLENVYTKMSKIQYLAIRALLQEEIEAGDNSTLRTVLTVLVDRDDVLEKTRQEFRDQIDRAAKSVPHKAGSAAVAEKVRPIIKNTIGKMELNETVES